MSRRNPVDFQFEKPQACGRHTPITMSPSDPHADGQQDDNYATGRRAAAWKGPPFAVRALTMRADYGMSMAGIGVMGGIIRHIACSSGTGSMRRPSPASYSLGSLSRFVSTGETTRDTEHCIPFSGRSRRSSFWAASSPFT